MNNLIRTPVAGVRKVSVEILFFFRLIREQFITFVSVADSVRKLEVVEVGGVASFCDWDDVVNRWRKRVICRKGFVYRLAAYGA
jgi:hypothetical protein